MTGTIRVGISGWRYVPWRGTFYPTGLPHRLELRYAAERLDTVEINGSFYSLQRPQSYWRWYEDTPDGFVFAVKGARFITHMKKLRDIEAPLANFLSSGVLALGDKLGPLLWQLPPMLPFQPERLLSFFSLLPRSTDEACYLARRHEERMLGRAWTGVDADRPLRHAVEARHMSFDTPAFLEMAREHCIAAVLSDAPERWPVFREPTTDFAYVRMHGAQELYVSGYDAGSLDSWAATMRGWNRDTYVYFDNDVKAHAPRDAMALRQRLRPLPAA